MSFTKPTRPRSYKRRLLIDGAIITVALGLMLGWMLIIWIVPLGDFAPVSPQPKIGEIVAPIEPIPQTNNHTCGFLAAAAVYRSYGLDPKERRLRIRLGTDNRTLVYDSETTGSLHPDFYRTLTQDGFDCTALDLDAASAREKLQSHLDAHRYALALIKRRETGTMHWVVIAGRTNSVLHVCDSLKPQIYDEPLDDYWDNCLLSVILLAPVQAEANPSVVKLHFRGIRDMYRAFRRK